MKTKFKEEQKFTQWWLWLFLIALGLFSLIGLYKQIIIGEPFGSKPMSNLGLIIMSIFFFGFIAMFYFMALKTVIDEDEIQIHFFPFLKKSIKWQDVDTAEMVKYGFVGGWGIRLGTKYGIVYNIRGNKGLAIKLKSGKKYLVGTQKEHELSNFIKKIGR